MKPLGKRRNEPWAPVAELPQTVPSCGPPRSLYFTWLVGMLSDRDEFGSCASAGCPAQRSPRAARETILLQIIMSVFLEIVRACRSSGPERSLSRVPKGSLRLSAFDPSHCAAVVYIIQI